MQRLESTLRRKVLLAAAVAAVAPTRGLAQTWPARPITLLVGSAAGGGTDEYARTLAEALGKRLGQPVVVENASGASGALAAQKTARSAPDGYTLLIANSDLVLAPLVHKSAGYTSKDLTPIALFGSSQLVLLAHPSVAANDVDQLVALTKAKPNSISLGLAGVASLPAVATSVLVKASGMDVLPVPYKGAAPAMTDLLAGQVQLAVTALVNGLPHIRSGKLKALGILSSQRSPLLPGVSAMAESRTAKGVSMDIWVGLVGPAGMPPGTVATLNRHLQDILKDPGFRADREAKGTTMAALGTPEEFGRFLAAEEARFRVIVPGMKLE